MIRLRLRTQITIWSVTVVTMGILFCGAVSTFYVYRKEREELDGQIAIDAKRFFEDWWRNGGPKFDWYKSGKEVNEWIPASVPPPLVEVVDLRNHTLFRSKELTSDVLSGLERGFHSVTIGTSSRRVGVFEDDGFVLRIAEDLDSVNDLTEELSTAFLLTLPVILVFAAFGGRLIAQKALVPIQKITAFAEQISVQRLGERVPLPPAQDEIQRLAIVLNSTFDRLEQSFHQATRFSADASHELKTPLTVLRTSVETLLRTPNLDLQVEQGLSCMLEATKRLASVTESLLLLSRADAGKLALDLSPSDMIEIIDLCADDAAIMMEGRRIEMERDLPASAPVLIDRTRLSQILMNLFDNALKYNRDGGKVRVTLVAQGNHWHFSVANTGPGIVAENIPHLFTRFFRGEHSGEVSGHGLGLSLSRELARAQGGDLVLGESDPGWTTFVLTLPKPNTEKAPQSVRYAAA